MTIRRILLIAFLLVSLAPSVVLILLAFNRTHDAMQAQIEQAVVGTAAAVSDDFDTMLAERFLNATTWNHVEVMQDLRLGDVDKRLSSFLAGMKHRYGDTYLALHAVDAAGHVIASSDPAAIGSVRAATSAWQTARLPGGEVQVSLPSRDRAARRLELRTQLDSPFTDRPIGELVLDVSWSALEDLLDEAADASREVVVVDAQGRVVAASSGLRAQGIDWGSEASAWWPKPGHERVSEVAGVPGMPGVVLLGRQASRGAGGFAGFGWTAAIAQSRDIAFAPVRRMGWAFAGLLAAAAAGTVAIAFWVAGVIARPVVALTEFTRNYLNPGTVAKPPAEGPGELGELQRSFVRLVEDLQRSQQSLVQASRLAALGEVTALMAHEVRTPLGILRSSAQMLAQEKNLSPEGGELLGIVETETARLNRLMGAILDSTRSRAPKRAPTDLHGLIERVRTMLAASSRERGVEIRLAPRAERPIADCDGEQVTQLLLNLAMNAIQVLPRGGRVEIATYNEHRRIVIEVGDDGPGVPVEDRASLFEPFVYKREGGTGLGLAVVRQIARSHGGDVAVESSPLGGALFRVWLPLDNPEALGGDPA